MIKKYIILLIIITKQIHCNDGTLDTTFGPNRNGTVLTSGALFGSTSRAGIISLAVQSDNKIVAGGFGTSSTTNFALARYNINGSLDTSFGINGIVTTSISGGSQINSLIIQSDGKIIAAGESNDNFTLVRYNTDGSIDTLFGTNGIVTTSIGNGSGINSVAIQSDGKIIAGGSSATSGGSIEFALTRYNTNGSLDTSFGTDGIVTLSIGGIDDAIRSVAIQSNGKIVVGGITTSSILEIAVARFNTDGSIDTSFATNGIFTQAAGTNSGVSAIAIQPDGKILGGGFSHFQSNSQFYLLRLAENGVPDSTFGTNGNVTIPIGTSDEIFSILIQPNKNIVAGGFVTISGTQTFGITRVNTNGVIDPYFGTNGITIIFPVTIFASNITSAITTGESLAIQFDPGLILGGRATDNSSNEYFALARFNLNLNCPYLSQALFNKYVV